MPRQGSACARGGGYHSITVPPHEVGLGHGAAWARAGGGVRSNCLGIASPLPQNDRLRAPWALPRVGGLAERIYMYTCIYQGSALGAERCSAASQWQEKCNKKVPRGNSTSRQQRWDIYLDFGICHQLMQQDETARAICSERYERSVHSRRPGARSSDCFGGILQKRGGLHSSGPVFSKAQTTLLGARITCLCHWKP